MIGTLVVRVVVPAWILAGVLLKFGSRDPALMPKQFRGIAHGMSLDLKTTLAIVLIIEICAIAVMLFNRNWSRLTALLMLSVFVIVLAMELITGNMTNCGCLGSYSPPPWVMLLIDCVLLLLVITMNPSPLGMKCMTRLGNIQAFVMAAVASTIAVIWVLDKPVVAGSTLPAPTAEAVVNDGDESIVTGNISTEKEVYGDAASTDTTPARDWYELDTTDWVGQNVMDIDLVKYTRGLPDDLEQGEQYLIYYSRTCDHCQMLLEFHFGFGSPVPTTLVAVPENQEGFATEGLLENPCLDCRLAELPPGVNWIMTPPVVMALRDGEVICVKEAEDSDAPECLPFQ
ncbi:MAG: hypothetical protein CMJ40_11375 [Phycisphaerae bacterium]|nr:hypothetical protein [Phycisphaerae bacterium]